MFHVAEAFKTRAFSLVSFMRLGYVMVILIVSLYSLGSNIRAYEIISVSAAVTSHKPTPIPLVRRGGGTI